MWLTVALAAPFDADLAVLAAASGVDGPSVGYAGVTTDTWRAFEHLRAVATVEDLRSLLAHPSPVVRTYVLYALADVEPDVTALLFSVLDDRAPVYVQAGCSGQATTVADHALLQLGGRVPAADRPRLFAALLAEHPPLGWTCWTLGRDVPPEIADALLHQADAGWDCALPALAHLRRPEDLPRIRAELAEKRWSGWAAAAAFPDPTLLDAVRAVRPDELPQPFLYFRAAAAFGADGVDLLLAGLPAHAFDVWRAVTPHAAEPELYPVFFALLERHGMWVCDAFDGLRAADPERAERALTTTLLPTGLRAECADHLVEVYAEVSGAAGRAALVAALASSEITEFGPLARYAGRARMPDAVDVLLARLRKDPNPHVALAAVDALFAFDDPVITSRALAEGMRAMRRLGGFRRWGRDALGDRLAAEIVGPRP